MILYTKRGINERWRNRKGNEKVEVGSAERKESQMLPAAVVGVSFKL